MTWIAIVVSVAFVMVTLAFLTSLVWLFLRGEGPDPPAPDADVPDPKPYLERVKTVFEIMNETGWGILKGQGFIIGFIVFGAVILVVGAVFFGVVRAVAGMPLSQTITIKPEHMNLVLSAMHDQHAAEGTHFSEDADLYATGHMEWNPATDCDELALLWPWFSRAGGRTTFSNSSDVVLGVSGSLDPGTKINYLGYCQGAVGWIPERTRSLLPLYPIIKTKETGIDQLITVTIDDSESTPFFWRIIPNVTLGDEVLISNDLRRVQMPDGTIVTQDWEVICFTLHWTGKEYLTKPQFAKPTISKIGVMQFGSRTPRMYEPYFRASTVGQEKVPFQVSPESVWAPSDGPVSKVCHIVYILIPV